MHSKALKEALNKTVGETKVAGRSGGNGAEECEVIRSMTWSLHLLVKTSK
jgi:hypothetical protein